MASLKEIRTRIKSVSSTRQITSAMKMVSAAKLKRAQIAILQIRPYANKLHEILAHLSTSVEISSGNIYAQQREIKKVLVILVTSNKGLCGAFNANVIKKTITMVTEKYQDVLNNDGINFICIGKKGYDALKTRKYKIEATYHNLLDDLDFSGIIPIAQQIMDEFTKGYYDKVIVVYNQFKNAAVQILTEEQFLPIVPSHEEGESKILKADYIYEPTKEYIITELIPKSLRIGFYKALLDSVAAEHGARMTAMHKATDNATELIKELKLNYNKARQNAITKEILEIVGGAEALKG